MKYGESSGMSVSGHRKLKTESKHTFSGAARIVDPKFDGNG